MYVEVDEAGDECGVGKVDDLARLPELDGRADRCDASVVADKEVPGVRDSSGVMTEWQRMAVGIGRHVTTLARDDVSGKADV